MFCGNCGTKLPNEAKFCGSCGGKVEPLNPHNLTTRPPAATAATAPSYSPPVHQPYVPFSGPQHTPGSEPLSVGQYMGVFLLMALPIVNIILLFMWGFGSSVNLNKKNFAKASLILFAIMLVFWLIFGAVLGGILAELARY